jgi:IS1 family transposase
VKAYNNNEDIEVKNLDDFDSIHKIIYGRTSTVIKKQCIDKIFKSDFARIGSFLTGFCRLQLYKILKENFKDSEVKYINTDGFIVTKELPEKYIGSEMGKFKRVEKTSST